MTRQMRFSTASSDELKQELKSVRAQLAKHNGLEPTKVCPICRELRNHKAYILSLIRKVK